MHPIAILGLWTIFSFTIPEFTQWFPAIAFGDRFSFMPRVTVLTVTQQNKWSNDMMINKVNFRLSNAMTILLVKIPHGQHPCMTDKINRENKYLRNRGMKGGNFILVACCPSFPGGFQRNGLHFNFREVEIGADKLAYHMINSIW